MFESAADNSSILSIDLGLLIGLLVLQRLLDPLLTRDRILFGLTTGSLLIMYALWRWHDTLPTFAFSVQNFWQYFFFACEALAIVYTLMSMVILFRSIDRSGQPRVDGAAVGATGQVSGVKGKVTASSP